MAVVGKYDTYKGSTHVVVTNSVDNPDEGNMILIKDRHAVFTTILLHFFVGKYDTYKGSTLSFVFSFMLFDIRGKYDTYKGLIY